MAARMYWRCPEIVTSSLKSIARITSADWFFLKIFHIVRLFNWAGFPLALTELCDFGMHSAAIDHS